MTEKASGYFLIFAGIVIIVFSALSVVKVFSAKAKPVALFNFPSISLDAGSLVGGDLSPQEREALKASGQVPKLEIIPGDVLNQTSNLIAHLLLMGFIASIGYKIGSLGVLLARPVVVRLKASSGQVISENSLDK